MNSSSDSPQLQAITALLGREICRPLDSLRASLQRLLDDPTRPSSVAERAHATTMLGLCDDLKRFTRECLGEDGAPTFLPAATPSTVPTATSAPP